MLEDQGVKDYSVSPPTIEDVFLKVAQNKTIQAGVSPVDQGNEKVETQPDQGTDVSGIHLADGESIGMVRQAQVLFMKRWTILRRNWLPALIATVIPIIAAGCVTLFLNNFTMQQCDWPNVPKTTDPTEAVAGFSSIFGPSTELTPQRLAMLAAAMDPWKNTSSTNTSLTREKFATVDSIDQFNQGIDANYSTITPGGIYLGDRSNEPRFAWRADGDYGSVGYATVVQNMFDSQLINREIETDFRAFDVPWTPDVKNALQLIAYSVLVMACYPAFLALYPTFERTQSIRAMHYSNGVRSLPLWLAYLAFDSVIVLIASVMVIVIWVARSDVWYEPGYLFIVLFLYGIASVLLSYIISMFATSQLAAFAFAAGKQACFFLVYMIAYLSIMTYAPIEKIDSEIITMHFVIAVFSPIINLARAMFLTLNLFSVLCRGKKTVNYAGELKAYGGPILYLILQCLFLFGLLLWWDSGFVLPWTREKEPVADDEVLADADDHRGDPTLSPSNMGLRVLHLDKHFGKFVAVEDVTFGVPQGEVFALLGPNGAGKSTTIGLIRGDIRPSSKHGDVLINNVSIIRHRAKAQKHLGVCPQFDAMDQMTVVEQLRFYARVRGVSNPKHNVDEIIRAVGLQQYQNTLAAKLSEIRISMTPKLP
ncbi:ABC transporter domain containing protein [Ascosphaera apis ARSEF 7405]|uniref:ABC transporter domain containing protein n=1 Tax=Ascosphaera apis ARSEF 7405 TaxID=392613 RepID=A0A168DK08_9EURO|nr:ABC transporter domain containing protein [Ascosphaera apis ARSEF 7405]